MANLSDQFPSLESLGHGAATGLYFGDMFNSAQQNRQINQQSALQDMYHNEQMNPLRVKQAQANVDSTTQTTRGTQFKNDMNDRTKEEQYRAGIAKLARETSDDELKQTKNSIQQLGFSTDPQAREISRMLTSHYEDVVKEKEKQRYMADRQEGLAHVQGGYQLRAAEIGAKSRENVAAARNNVVSFESAFMKLKKASEKYAALRDQAMLMEKEGDMAAAQHYRQRAEEQKVQAEMELAAANEAKPGSVAVDRATGGRVPVVPSRGLPDSARRQSGEVGPPTQNPATQEPQEITQDQYNQLPKGSLYKRNGKTYRKL